MRGEIDVHPPISGKRRLRGLAAAIASLAAEQYGIVTRLQLLEIGLTRHQIDHLIATHRLHPVHRGVYAVGHRLLSARGRWLAAVLAAGEGAVLSHQAAADLWGLRASSGRATDVTVPCDRRQQPGIAIHRTKLQPHEITKRGPIRVTTPTRTIIDLASQVDSKQLERALREAIYLRLATTASLASCLSAHPSRRGSRTLRSLLPEANRGRTKSDLEADFLAFLRKHRLPLPELNATVEGFEVDCVWEARKLIVELDGRAAHYTPYGFEHDRARDAALLTAGWRVLRVTGRRLDSDQTTLAAQLRELVH